MRAFWTLVVVVLGCLGNAATADGPPNVVLILADDLGWGDLGCYQPDSKIPTPNLDALAASGMRFTDAHSPSAVCTPTRYGILTGRFAWRTRLKSGVLGPYSAPIIEPERLTIARLLSDAGYATACIGKWHLGMRWSTHNDQTVLPSLWDRKFDQSLIDLAGPITEGPLTAGFDAYFGTAVPNFPPYCFIEDDRILGTIPDRPKPADVHGNPGFMQEGWDLHHILPALRDRAVGFIEQQTREEPDRPFFLYLPLTAPHTPIVPNPEFAGLSEAGDYGDLVCEIDALVGAVLGALESAGVADETIVIFTSDNGSPARAGDQHIRDPEWARVGAVVRMFGHNPSGPWRGTKADIFEGGHRVPFIVRWPGRVPAGSVNDQLVGSIDLMATLADAVGLDLGADAAPDSVSLLPTLTDPGVGVRDQLVTHSSGGRFAIRRGEWKFIDAKGSGGWTRVELGPNAPAGQLYNLTNDPGETSNLYTTETERVADLRAALERAKSQ
jgi:arylsulfatase A